MTALAPRTVQNMPEGLRLEPITVLHPASITPEAHKEALLAELGIAHAFGMPVEIVRFRRNRCRQIGILRQCVRGNREGSRTGGHVADRDGAVGVAAIGGALCLYLHVGVRCAPGPGDGHSAGAGRRPVADGRGAGKGRRRGDGESRPESAHIQSTRPCDRVLRVPRPRCREVAQGGRTAAAPGAQLALLAECSLWTA